MKIVIPTECPVCASKLELVVDQLFCRNSQCEAQLSGKLNHFVKTLKIKGLGPATLEKLQFEDICDMFYITEKELASYIGDKLAAKLYVEIEKAKSADLATVIAAFGTPLVGPIAAAKIVSVINHIDELTYAKCKEAGLGEKVTENLMGWFTTEFKEVRDLLPFSYGVVKQQSAEGNGKIVCITGKLNSFKVKKDAATALEAKGFSVTDNLTKTVNYLIDESNKSSAKRIKAESYGITVVTDLLEFLQNN